MSVLCHREDALGGHQKEVSVVQLHVEGDISVGWVLEATGIPHLPQATIKLEKKEKKKTQMEINHSQTKLVAL